MMWSFKASDHGLEGRRNFIKGSRYCWAQAKDKSSISRFLVTADQPSTERIHSTFSVSVLHFLEIENKLWPAFPIRSRSNLHKLFTGPGQAEKIY